MPYQQLIDQMFSSLGASATAIIFAGLVLIILQVFATLVGIRILFFIWRALGLLETSVHEASLKQRGLWGATSQQALNDFHQAQTIKWRAAVFGMYVFCLMTPIVAVYFADRQLAAWVLLVVEVALLAIVGVVIGFN